MRNTFEFVVLVLLLVAGQFTVEEKRRSVGEMVLALGMWALFFGGLAMLAFLPQVVAWLLRALAALFGLWLLRWLVGAFVRALRGPSVVARLKPRQALEVAREVLLDGYHASVEARREFRRLKPLVRREGTAVFLRGAFSLAQETDRPADAPALCAALAEKVEASRRTLDELVETAERNSGKALGRWDRRLLAEAILLCDAESVRKHLSRPNVRLGGRSARKAFAEFLAKQAKAAPWRDELAAIGVGPPSRNPARRRRPPRACPPAGKLLLALLVPPAGYWSAGEKGRAHVLAAVWAALLGYALFALAEGRTVGWIFLATWGLVQLLAMFAVYDTLAAEE